MIESPVVKTQGMHWPTVEKAKLAKASTAFCLFRVSACIKFHYLTDNDGQPLGDVR
jgi:hypothetical protein